MRKSVNQWHRPHAVLMSWLYLMISSNECNRVCKECIKREHRRVKTPNGRDRKTDAWTPCPVEKGNIHSNPLRTEDFNESRDMGFEDSYGNSAGAPLQQCHPLWTHAMSRKPSSRPENVWELGL